MEQDDELPPAVENLERAPAKPKEVADLVAFLVSPRSGSAHFRVLKAGVVDADVIDAKINRTIWSAVRLMVTLLP